MSVINVKFEKTFSKNSELAEEIYKTISKYEELSLAEVLGILDIIKHHLIKGE